VVLARLETLGLRDPQVTPGHLALVVLLVLLGIMARRVLMQLTGQSEAVVT